MPGSRHPVGWADLAPGMRTAYSSSFGNADLLLWIGDRPDRAVCVLADEEGSVLCDGHAHRAAPNGCVVHDETGTEVVVLAGRHAVLETDTNDLVTGSFCSVP